MTFDLFGQTALYWGGPYLARPIRLPGIRMAAEIEAQANWVVPTEDFDTPPVDDLYRAMVQSIAIAVTENVTPYVGCMAGRGRTGLFMATLAYLTGVDNPVRHVRNVYYPHAVETPEQERFVTTTYDRAQFREDVMGYIIDEGLTRKGFFWSLPLRDKWLYVRTLFKRVW